MPLIPLQSRSLVPAQLVAQPWEPFPSADRRCLPSEPGVPLRMPGSVFLQCQAGVPGGLDCGPEALLRPLHGWLKRATREPILGAGMPEEENV